METDQLNKLINNPGLLNAETVEPLEELIERYPYFQIGWLLYLKNLKQVKSTEFDSTLKKVAIRIPDRKLLYKFLNTNFLKKHSGIALEKESPVEYELGTGDDFKDGNSLIDKFLTSNPGVIRQRNVKEETAASPLVNKIVENSTAENNEIITETLADIYFQQKNYDKAQNAYEKLSLKYPEKSVYFASRIEEIEKLKNI